VYRAMVVTWNGELGPERSRVTSEGEAPEALPASGIQLVSPAARPIVFAELYRTHFAYVWKSARRLGVQPADLDDVVQETFLNVHRLLDTYEAKGTEHGWLFAVLFRVVQRHRRTHAKEIIVFQTSSLHTDSGSSQNQSRMCWVSSIWARLSSCPFQC